MASPNFDALNLQHSRNIGDTVAAAATDGSAFSSAKRSSHLNAAIRNWMIDQLLVENLNGLSSYVLEATASLTGNALSLASGFTGGVLAVISVKNNNRATMVRKIPITMKHIVDNAYSNSFLATTSDNQYWTINGGNLVLIGSGATDSVSVIYVSRHTDLAVAGASDIAIPPTYWTMILDYALLEALKEKPQTEEVVARIKIVLGSLESVIQKSANAKLLKNG